MSTSENGRGSVPHFVDRAPFDPNVTEVLTPEQERFYMASQWQMMWWKLRRHRLAVISGAFLLFMYVSIMVSELIAPYALATRHTDHIYAPPQGIHLFHEGEFVGPFVYGYDYELDMRNLQRVYTANLEKVEKLRFFCSGDPTSSGACSMGISTSFARRRVESSSCSAPTA